MLWGNDIIRADYAFKMAIWRNLWVWHTFPLWDPTILGGRSIVGDPIYALLNPPSLIFWLSPSPLLFGYFAWVHVLVGSWGMYLLARKMSYDPLAALFTAVVFAYSGKTAAHIFAGHLLLVASVLCLPWLMLFIERIFEYRRRKDVIILGFLAALLVSYGTFQIVYTHLLFLGAYVTIRGGIYWYDRERGHALRSLGALSVAGLIGLGISTVVWFPAVRQTLLLSARAKESSVEFASMGSATFFDLLRLVWPFIGLPDIKPLENDAYHLFFWESTSYPGLVALALAIAALFVIRKDRQLIALTWLGVVALVLALANSTPLFTVVYNFLPGYGLFRSWGRMLFYMIFVVALLAGRLLSESGKSQSKLVGFLGIFALLQAAFVGTIRLQFTDFASSKGWWLPLLILLVLSVLSFFWTIGRAPKYLWQSGCLVALLAELLYFWGPTIQTVSVEKAIPNTELAQFLTEQKEHGDFRVLDTTYQLKQQVAAQTGLEIIGGYHPGMYASQVAMYSKIWRNDASSAVELIQHPPEDIVCENVLDLLNVRYIVASRPWHGDEGRMVKRIKSTESDASQFVFERPQSLPRAFVVPNAENAPPGLSMADILCSITPREICLVDGDPIAGTAEYQKLSIVTESPASISSSFNLEGNGVAIFSQTWHPDWRATDKGQPLPVLRVNEGLVGVSLSAGTHELRISYFPWDFYSAAVLSALSFFIVVGHRCIAYGWQRPAI